MSIKLKAGRTYVTRSGVKRVIQTNKDGLSGYPFIGKSLSPQDDFEELWTASGKYIASRIMHKWDLIAEVKKNA